MDPDPGGPKTYGSYGSGSATLVYRDQHTAEGYLEVFVESLQDGDG